MYSHCKVAGLRTSSVYHVFGSHLLSDIFYVALLFHFILNSQYLPFNTSHVVQNQKVQNYKPFLL